MGVDEERERDRCVCDSVGHAPILYFNFSLCEIISSFRGGFVRDPV